ncbi:hypothetical protein [Glaciecola petra]|uniref:Uncharacterized protein n=1 Tax=Glaciecola petra TaxID=3075602 RepID=A0ABU2ZSE7_9ALTE|nr:hypothetical protein [Aestuariibacter sp. P117]MDT0594953.1 hypothetical protein [Aestuariibacter sp. P117]
MKYPKICIFIAFCSFLFSAASATATLANAEMQTSANQGRELQGRCSDAVRKKVQAQKDRAAVTKKDCMQIRTFGSYLTIEGTVAPDDAVRIRRAIKQAGSAVEVRLNSGGGDSAEGMKIGLEFRASNLLIRIANRSSCASACTVAFMGGNLRTIDDGAGFQVHIYSGFRDGFNHFNNYDFNRLRKGGYIWKDELLKSPRDFLLGVVKYQHGLRGGSSIKNGMVYDENYYRSPSSIKVARRFNYLRSMIQPPSQRFSYDGMLQAAANLTKRLQQKRAQSYEFYVKNQLAQDIKQIELGGRSAAHQIAMRIERDTAFNMIAGICEINEAKSEFSFISNSLKPYTVADSLFSLCNISRFDQQSDSQNSLGPRSNFALRMIITMFESRIQGVSELSQETLFNYGFTNVEE